MRGRLQYGILFLLVVIACVGVLAWSIISRGFSAKDEPGAAEAFIARGFRHMAIPRRAREARKFLPEQGSISPITARFVTETTAKARL
jgi:hypothetical protein